MLYNLEILCSILDDGGGVFHLQLRDLIYDRDLLFFLFFLLILGRRCRSFSFLNVESDSDDRLFLVGLFPEVAIVLIIILSFKQSNPLVSRPGRIEDYPLGDRHTSDGLSRHLDDQL